MIINREFSEVVPQRISVARELWHSIQAKEITHEVNKFDESFGLDLSSKEVWSSAKKYRKRVIRDAETAITALICVINGINPKEYIDRGNDVPFTTESIFDWNFASMPQRGVDTVEFRAKFVTIVLVSFLGNVKDVVRRYCYEKNYKIHKHEHEIMATRDLVAVLERFAVVMLQPKNPHGYRNAIMAVLIWVSYIRPRKHYKHYIHIVTDHIEFSRRYSRKDLASGVKLFDDDDTIEAIIETSYMIITERLYDKHKYLPGSRYFAGATRYHDIIKLIEVLGAAILTNRKGEDYSPLYLAFRYAKPLIYTAYQKEARHNAAIMEGIYAIEFLRFIYNDTVMDRFITQLLKRGI